MKNKGKKFINNLKFFIENRKQLQDKIISSEGYYQTSLTIRAFLGMKRFYFSIKNKYENLNYALLFLK